MKVIIVALALVAVAASAAVPAEYEVVPIVRSESNQSPEGSYNFAFETGNGIQRVETGEVKEALDEDKKPVPVVVVRGSYSYTDPEGNVETINFTADEDGYHPEGKSIPQPPSRR